MNNDNIKITDINGSRNIHSMAPLLILNNIPLNYLIRNDKDVHVYNINIDKLYNSINDIFPKIDKFIPVGQIYISNDKLKTSFNILMANTGIIPTTNNFEEIKKNVWVAIIRKNNKIIRSIGTIYNINTPDMIIPVFPSFFMKCITEKEFELNCDEYNAYSDIYSDNDYGKWILNKYMLNFGNNKLKEVDNILHNDDTNLGINNISLQFIPLTKKKDDKIKTIILKEKKDPWFSDMKIVGEVALMDQPYKITGKNLENIHNSKKCNIIEKFDDISNDTENINNIIIYVIFIIIIILLIYRLSIHK